MDQNINSKPNKTAAIQKKLLKKRKRQLIGAVMLLFLTFYVLINLFIVSFFLISFNRSQKQDTKYPIYFVNANNKNVAIVGIESAYKNQTMYIPYYSFDALCNLSIMGDNEKITIFLNGSRDYMECFNNSSLVYINGSPVRISAPIIFTLNDYLLPAEILTDYIDGLNLFFNANKKRYDISYADSSQRLSFKIKSTEAIDKPQFPE